MKNLILIILWMLAGTVHAAEMRFNEHGKLLQPDQTYLNQGLKDQEQGYLNDARRNFKKAAKFGNPYAQSAMAYMYLKDKDYIHSLAWFQLVDLKLIDKDEIIIQIKKELTSILSQNQLQQVDQLTQQLVSEYGREAAYNHRLDWQNNISIGGTKFKGKVPGRVKVYPSARIETNGLEYEIFVSPVNITGTSVERQMNEFVFEYELKFTRGKVSMDDIELIDEDKNI